MLSLGQPNAIDLSENIFLPFLTRTRSADSRLLYHDHRAARSAAQRALLLDPAVPLVIDDVLTSILATNPPDFARDKRHNLTVWARPSKEVIALVEKVQGRLREAVGDDQGIWFPPPDALHMTVFEIASGVTQAALRPIVDALVPHAAALTSPHASSLTAPAPVLDAPTLNLELSGIALSFLPRTDALLQLRAALWDTAARAGVRAQFRYALPTAHVTVGRFVARGRGLGMPREEWVRLVEGLNEELGRWEGAWRVERLVLRAGVSWYGGGTTVGGDE